MVSTTLAFAYLALKVKTGAPIRKDFCFHLDDELAVKGWLGTESCTLNPNGWSGLVYITLEIFWL
jgi:hypothetical protein